MGKTKKKYFKPAGDPGRKKISLENVVYAVPKDDYFSRRAREDRERLADMYIYA